MSAMTHIPPDIGDTIIAIIIYFAATSILFENLYEKIMKKIKANKETSTEAAA